MKHIVRPLVTHAIAVVAIFHLAACSDTDRGLPLDVDEGGDPNDMATRDSAPGCPTHSPEERAPCDGSPMCQYQYTTECTGQCQCLPGYGWNCVVNYSQACAASQCPPHPAEGDSCSPPRFDCTIESPNECFALTCMSGTNECPSPCVCDKNTNKFRCNDISAGPACPSAICPAQPPLYTTEGNPPCDPAVVGSHRCDYRHQIADGECSAICSCLPDGVWSCSTDCECPTSEPEDGSSCWIEAVGQSCDYPSKACVCVGESLDVRYWDCYHGDGRPDELPADGAPCQHDLVQNRQSVEQIPNCYECRCESDTWSCGPSTCTDCPTTKPQPGTQCSTPMTCPYSTNAASAYCECSGLWWSC